MENKARRVFNQFVNMLNERDWKFDHDEERMVIQSGVSTDDFPVEFFIIVDGEHSVVRFLSKLPFKAPEDKLMEVALAVCGINNYLIDGNFDFDLNDGSLLFRMTASFIGETELCDDALERLILTSASTVDEYNDKLFMIIKNMLSIDDFLASLAE